MPISTDYDPTAHSGAFCWIWDEDCDALGEGGWRLVRTFQDDGVYRAHLCDADEVCDADQLSGRPCIPADEPGCGSDAGLLVSVRLPDGAGLQVSREEDGPEAENMRDALVTLLTRTEPSSADICLDALRDCRDRLYEILYLDIQGQAKWGDDGIPRAETLDRDSRCWIDPIVSAILGAEHVLGRDLGNPGWLTEALGRWPWPLPREDDT